MTSPAAAFDPLLAAIARNDAHIERNYMREYTNFGICYFRPKTAAERAAPPAKGSAWRESPIRASLPRWAR